MTNPLVRSGRSPLWPQTLPSEKKHHKTKYHHGTLQIVPEDSIPKTPRSNKLGSSNPVVIRGKGQTSEIEKTSAVVRRSLSSPVITSQPKTRPKTVEVFTLRSLNAFVKSKGVDKEAQPKQWDFPATGASLTLDTFVLDPSEIDAFPEFPAVERLSLFKCSISDAQFIALIKRLEKTLTELHIDFCFELTADVLKLLPLVRKIEIGRRPPLNDATLLFLVHLAQTLQHFSCNNAELTDDALTNTFLKFENLISVDISNCSCITDKGFLALTNLPLLKQVTITGCRIGEDAIADFYRRAPGVKIYRSFEMCPRPPELAPSSDDSPAPKVVRRAHSASSFSDELDALLEETDKPAQRWRETPSTLTEAEKRERARAYLKEKGFFQTDEELGDSKEDIHTQDILRIEAREPAESPVLSDLQTERGSPPKEEEDFYAPVLTQPPTYVQAEDLTRALVLAPQARRRPSLTDVFSDLPLAAAPFDGPERLEEVPDPDSVADGKMEEDRPGVTAPGSDERGSSSQLVLTAAASEPEEDDFFNPHLSKAPHYHVQEMPDAEPAAGQQYHANPNEDGSSAVRPSKRPPVGRSTAHPQKYATVSSLADVRKFAGAEEVSESTPALLMADEQRDPLEESRETQVLIPLQNYPFVYHLVQHKGLAPVGGQPILEILPDLRSVFGIRNDILSAQNIEAIADTGVAHLRSPETALVDLDRIDSFDAAEKALQASETIINLRRMRPLLSKVWEGWIKKYRKFCGRIPERFTHFKEFDQIPDEGLESAIRWLGNEPLVFTGTKQLQFEILPERLTMVPSCITQLPLTDLEVLSFDGHRISFLPANFFLKSTGLKWFSITDNQLEAVPDRLTETWREIEVLHFNNNQISALPRKLGFGCRRLKTLFFADNNIAMIPDELVVVLEALGTQKLQVFDVSRNCLKQSPTLQKLKGILRSSKVEHLPEL